MLKGVILAFNRPYAVRYNAYMGRPAISEYQVKKAKKPNSGKVWHIVGRPNGKRIRA